MQAFFSAEGERALAALLRLTPLLAFDFDGTLAPIVERPDDARAAPDVAERLVQLARRAPVAIVTGRSVADVRPRLGFEPRFVIGNHGAEDPLADAPSAESLGLAFEALQPLRTAVAAAAPALHDAGVEVEDKRHSLALHYRRAADPARAQQCIEALLHGLDPALKAYGGKCVVNVVAAAAPDKGDAVRALVARAGAGAALFVGDDLNDEAVFTSAEAHWLTVRVGHDAASRAMFFIDGHAQMPALLNRLLAGL